MAPVSTQIVMQQAATALRQKNAKYANMFVTALLELLLHDTKPDIVMGTETWLEPNIESSEIFPSDYTVYRRDRPTDPHGGVVLLIHNRFISAPVPEIETDSELVWAKISRENGKDMYVGCCYRSDNPRFDHLQQIDDINHSLDLIGRTSSMVLLGGDFNLPDIDWESNSVKPNSSRPQIHNKFIDSFRDHDLEQVVTLYTRDDNTLDLLLTNTPGKVNRVETLPPLSSSDHDIVFAEMELNFKTNRKAPRRIYKYHKADWDSFKTELKVFLHDLLQENSRDVNHVWGQFCYKIKELRDKYIPSKMAKGKHHIPWVTPGIRRLIRKRNKYCRMWRRTGKHKLEQHFKKLRSETQKAIRQSYWKYVEDLLDPTENLDTEHKGKNFKKFWAFIKALKRDHSGVAPLKHQGNLETSPIGKASALNHQFKSVFVEEGDSAVLSKEPSPYTSINNINITEPGVAKLLNNLNTNKAGGPDEINAKILKELKSEIAPFLTYLFQISLDTGSVPSDWKNANVTPIFKKGERYVPSNYRPVSLTCITCKLMEHIIVSHLMKHAENNDIFYNLQFGFRSNRSGDVQLLQLYHDLAYNVHKSKQTDVLVMDFAKAFDTVPHKRLLYKLDWYGVRGNITNWISAFLSDRNQRVIVDGYHSDWTSVTSGVPQGSVLGPCLFLYYINDLPEYTKNSKVRLFADDCILYRLIKTQHDAELLQQDLLSMEKWEHDWLMRFNASKCSILTVTNKIKHIIFQYQFHGTHLERVRE